MRKKRKKRKKRMRRRRRRRRRRRKKKKRRRRVEGEGVVRATGKRERVNWRKRKGEDREML